jgi:lipoyl(octanoyl) transferase
MGCRWINPCGYSGLETIDMRSMDVEAPLADVQLALANELVRLLEVAAPAEETTVSI